MDDLRIADVDFLTLGQYLQPTVKHAAVDRFVPPEEFADYAAIARAKGFLLVSATPLTRSSYHADCRFRRISGTRAPPGWHCPPPDADPRRTEDRPLCSPSNCSTWWPGSTSIPSSSPGASPRASAPAPTPSWSPT